MDERQDTAKQKDSLDIHAWRVCTYFFSGTQPAAARIRIMAKVKASCTFIVLHQSNDGAKHVGNMPVMGKGK